ncbi:uncharacterized protein spdo [Periplaneta americana]|uniref:uncharacterized protein spdo n=1 Tax=Periplaneta americana TaxID=6978 RepID=UPI0037E830CA
MASPRTSSGYNNPAFSNQYDYDKLARYPSPGVLNHGNQTYIATAEVDNYCYEEDEIQMSVVVPKQRHLVREPPIGAATTLRIYETGEGNLSPRITATPTSPKRHRQNITITSPGNRRRNETNSRHSNGYKSDTIASPSRVHRYETIPSPDDYENETFSTRNTHRYETISASTNGYRNETISPPSNDYRNDTISCPSTSYRNEKISSHSNGHRNETITSPRTPKKDVSIIMTSTPRKPNAAPLSPRGPQTVSPRRHQQRNQTAATTPRRAILATSPTRPPVRSVKYVVTSQPLMPTQRSTAVIAPMYSANTSMVSTIPATPKKEAFLAKSPAKMEISPGLKASWIQIPEPYQSPPTGTIVTAGAILLLCGAISTVLCLYMMFQNGRRYYLDFGMLSGFGSVLLGCLGFRSRRWQWLPNRNYVSGYIILSMFSLLTCAGLIVILTVQPKPGEPLADVAGGAVCGIAVLSLILAAVGIISSRCCKYPPPDNRVEHCAEGFTL